MGQWKLPDTKEEVKKLAEYKKELKALRGKLDQVIGDDIIWDGFDKVEERLNYFLDGEHVKDVLAGTFVPVPISEEDL